MIFYEKIKNMTQCEMRDFILHQIHSDCNGRYDDDCKEEGYESCRDCIEKMLNRQVKE